MEEEEIGLVKFSNVKNFQRMVDGAEYARDENGRTIPRSLWPRVVVRFPPIIFRRLCKRKQEITSEEFYAEIHAFARNAIVMYQRIIDEKIAPIWLED